MICIKIKHLLIVITALLIVGGGAYFFYSNSKGSKASTSDSPRIIMVSPRVASSRSIITVTGLNFGTIKGRLCFTIGDITNCAGSPYSGYLYTIGYWSNTRIVAVLSSNPFPTGAGRLSVMVGGSKNIRSNAIPFTIIPPVGPSGFPTYTPTPTYSLSPRPSIVISWPSLTPTPTPTPRFCVFSGNCIRNTNDFCCNSYAFSDINCPLVVSTRHGTGQWRCINPSPTPAPTFRVLTPTPTP